MTDEDILRLAGPFLSMRDTAQPMIRGREDIIGFARWVLTARVFFDMPDNIEVATALTKLYEQRRQQDPA